MLFLIDKQNVLVLSQNRVETAGLAPQLIYSTFGLCLNPSLPCLGPRYAQTAPDTELCVPSSATGTECSCCHCWADTSPQLRSWSSICPEPGLGQSFLPPLSPTPTPLPPPVLPVPLCSRTRTMLQAQKVLDLFQRCCGKSCTPKASMSELHPTLVPISQLQRSGF